MTDERRLIKDSARAFTMKEVLPVANELDPVQGKIPMDLRQKMADMGYFGITIPTRYGGMGLGCFEYCLVAEELARGWMSVASLIARGNGLIGSRGMTEEQLQDRLPKVARGEWLGAFSMSEPGAGSDIAALTCRAVQDGDEWVITGNKYWCTFADDADYIYVVARTEAVDPKARHKGISGFIVEKPRGELPNNCKGAAIPKIGYF
ncbi:MAG: acyl-CoA dehydrogenase family protein, partial [Alphaproteobacteria bacterium]